MNYSAQILDFWGEAQTADQSKKWENVRLSKITVLSWPNADAILEIKPIGKGRAGVVLAFNPVPGEHIRVPLDDYNVTLKYADGLISAAHFMLYYGDDFASAYLHSERGHMAYPIRPGIALTAPVLEVLDIKTRIEFPKIRAIVSNAGTRAEIKLVSLDISGGNPTVAHDLSDTLTIDANFSAVKAFASADTSPLNPGDKVGVSMVNMAGNPIVVNLEVV